MRKILLVALAACATSLFAANPTPALPPAPKQQVVIMQVEGVGPPLTLGTLPWTNAGLKATPLATSPGTVRIAPPSGIPFVQFSISNGDVSLHYENIPVCPPAPAPLTRIEQCSATNPGTTGTWMQTATWSAAKPQVPPDDCWVQGPWLPTTAPAGACTTVQPPPSGNLVVDYSYVNQSSPEFQGFKSFVDQAVAGHPDYLFSASDAATMFRITAQQQYATLAIQMADAQVTAAEQAEASGGTPAIAGDSYLQAGPMLQDVAETYAWCNALLTASQKTRWAAYAAQTIFNIWHASQAAWGGHAHPWTGWGTDDPGDNYYYSFMKASMFWALAANDAQLLADLRNVHIPLVMNYMASISGGGSLEGTGYGLSHMVWFEDVQAWLDSTGQDLGAMNPHLANTGAFWVFATTPDLQHFVSMGDQSRSSEPTTYDYNRRVVLEDYHLSPSSPYHAAEEWWLRHIPIQQVSGFGKRYNMFPVGPGTTPPTQLNFRAPEVGLITGTTGWTAADTQCAIVMGIYNQSHAHQEQGAFTCYKGAWSAVTANIWSHSGINQGTDTNNVVRFERSGAVQPQHACASCAVNVTAYSTGTGGSFHVVGDITPLYQAGEGVTSWKRTADFASGALTITDALTLASGTTAIDQVDVPTVPTVSGNIVTTAHARITVLAPANPTINIVDMRTVNVPGYGNDFNSGYRIEISGSMTGYSFKVEPQ